MTKKAGIALQRHQEIGTELCRIDKMLTSLSVEFANAYPLRGEPGRTYRELRKAVHALTDARCFAEKNYFRDHPEQAELDTYYPGQDPGPYHPGKK